jgi:hypothetical protein
VTCAADETDRSTVQTDFLGQLIQIDHDDLYRPNPTIETFHTQRAGNRR